MKQLILLIFVTAVGYTYYTYPEACSAIAELVISETKDMEFAKNVYTYKDSIAMITEKYGDVKENVLNMYQESRQQLTSWNILSADTIKGSEEVGIEKQKTNVIGDVYELQYSIVVNGIVYEAKTRCVSKPKVARNAINYTFPTGQKYSLTIPDNGQIIMHSVSKISEKQLAMN